MKTKTEPSKPEELNFTFSLLKNVDRDFAIAIDQGCYLKKALLTRLLTVEIERLNAALPVASDASIKSHVRAQQNSPVLKSSWIPHQVSLPANLVRRVQEVCQEKGVVRDAFVNRVLFLATAKQSVIDHHFGLHEFATCDYFSDEYFNKDRAYELTMQRLTVPVDPLASLEWALSDSGDSGWAEPGYLYRKKLFEFFGKPKTRDLESAKVLAEDERNTESARLKRHLILWSLTCWAEPVDLQTPEFDLSDF